MTKAHNPLCFIGLHQPSDSKHFALACISIHRIFDRIKPLRRFRARRRTRVLVDSGAFTKLAKHGCYPEPVQVFAGQLYRLWTLGVVRIVAAVAQDYMCEPFMVTKTGLTVAEHQRLTIERYDALIAKLNTLFGGHPPFPIMPVLQGFTVEDYVNHIADYGDRLSTGMWVGVGSVCKRQGNPTIIAELLTEIKKSRPDLRLHGFGVKLTALKHPTVRELLFSVDSMAWSFSARKQGRNANDWREAEAFRKKIAEVA